MRLAYVASAMVALALTGVIGWELADTGSAPPPRSAKGPVPVDGPANTAASAQGGPATPDPTSRLLARPLFSPERRPPALAAAPAAASAVAPEAALPRLSGVLVTADGRTAVFASSPQQTVVREGGRLGSYTVRSIEPGLVTLEGPGGLRAIRPSFDPARPSPAQPAQAGSPAAPIGIGPGQAGAGLPLLPGSLSALPGSAPASTDGTKDAMPFERILAPSGLDIIRNQAARAGASGTAPVR